MSVAEKSALREANDNPWYCLATLYGEQPPEAAVGDWDVQLAEKNRVAWNRWMATHLSDEQRAKLLETGVSEAILAPPLTPEEQNVLCSHFASRTGRANERPPDPAKGIDFAHTHFVRVPIFNSFLFAGDADFTLATFSQNAHFMGTWFAGGTRFDSATFSGNAYLRATFSGYTNFDSATFFGTADFWKATFSFYVYFISTIFSKSVDFRLAKFKNVDFMDAQFNTNTLFGDACFETCVPDFRGARMHEATEWHGVKWPGPPHDKKNAQDQVYAYERLKQEMERLRKYEDEQFFFRKELRARRGLLSTGSGAWLLNSIYEASSDYGQSIARPIFWLFVLFSISGVVFAATPVFNGARMTIPLAASVSFANIFSFLPVNREIITAELFAGLSSTARIIGIVQSVLGALLLFLLGLALRTRFRMR